MFLPFLRTAFTTGLCLLLISCKSEEDGAAISNSVTPGVIDVTGGFNVKVNPSAGMNYMIHKEGDFTAPCLVSASSVGTGLSNTFINCIVEVEELEGAFGGNEGISMVLNVPPSMCKYVTYRPYFYFGLDHGVGPTAVVSNFDINGNFISTGSSITGPGVFNPDGTVRCNFDYSSNDGPNCCYGSYTNTVTAATASGPTTTVTTEEWGGAPGDCVAGAGSAAPRAENTNMPVTVYYFKPNGFNDAFTTGKRSIIDGDSSLFYANYFSGAPPAAFKISSNFPANPYYEWYCLDDSEDELARIRVQIREWNDIDEFALGASGNPDTTGTELSGSPVNDYWDWLDVFSNGNGFPGMPE